MVASKKMKLQTTVQALDHFQMSHIKLGIAFAFALLKQSCMSKSIHFSIKIYLQSGNNCFIQLMLILKVHISIKARLSEANTIYCMC